MSTMGPFRKFGLENSIATKKAIPKRIASNILTSINNQLH